MMFENVKARVLPSDTWRLELYDETSDDDHVLRDRELRITVKVKNAITGIRGSLVSSVPVAIAILGIYVTFTVTKVRTDENDIERYK